MSSTTHPDETSIKMFPSDADTVVRNIIEKLLSLKGVNIGPKYPIRPLSVPKQPHQEPHLIQCTGIKNALSPWLPILVYTQARVKTPSFLIFRKRYWGWENHTNLLVNAMYYITI
jgi:hypothetical protein